MDMKRIRKDDSGRYRWKKGTEKAGRFASKAEMESEILLESGYRQVRGGRYQYAAGTEKAGQFAPKIEVEEARTGARNERINLMTWNRLNAEKKATTGYSDLQGFLDWGKDAWTGRNAVAREERTAKIIEATGSRNLEEAWAKYTASQSYALYHAILDIDEATLKKEFSSIADDMDSYISYLKKLRAQSDNALYEEAKSQAAAWEASHATF